MRVNLSINFWNATFPETNFLNKCSSSTIVSMKIASFEKTRFRAGTVRANKTAV